MTFVPSNHEDPKDPGVVMKVIVKKDDLQKGRLQMVNWAKLQVGKSFRPHYHEDLEEVYVIMSGKGEMTIGDETEIVGPGDRIIIASREVHIMKNVGEQDIEFLAIGVSGEKGGKTVLV